MTPFWALLAWAGMLPVLPVVYFTQKNDCKPKKNIIVGVTLPYEFHHEAEVTALLERYKLEMKRTCWIMLAVVVPSLFFKSAGVFLTYYITWAVVAAGVFMVPYIRCNKALRKLKEERGWRRRPEAAQVVTDLRAAAEEMRWISTWWFLPPFLTSLVPLAFDRTLGWLWAIDAALVPLFYLCYRHLYRNRAEVVDENSERTIALTRIRRYNWGKCWLFLAWATGAFSIGLWLTAEHIWLCMAVILAYGLAVCGVVIGIEFRVRRLQEKLTENCGCCVDEDERWIWGMFYYNPDDSRCLVNARVGMNSTFNLARRPAQIFSGLLLALLLACPLRGVWLIGMEHAPVSLEVTDTEIVGAHYGGHWRVALDEIKEAALLEEKPSLSRVAGTGLPNAWTGRFGSDMGQMTVCLDPQVGPWLLVERTDGTLYLFGSSEKGKAERAASMIGAD